MLNNSKELLNFFKSTSFSKAILISLAVSIPIILGIITKRFEIGLALCFGAFWCSPSDVNGSLKHKQIGILFSALLVSIISFIGGFLHLTGYFLYPILGVLTFCIAFISIYGFRASLISFSGLLALVLSFAHTLENLEVYQYALLIGLGGLWYLLISTIWYYINPKAQTEELLKETIVLTAEFLNVRKKLIGKKKEKYSLKTKLMTLQSELTEHHETLREILILSRKSSGKSNYQSKRLLVFIQLIEILENAIANPVNNDKRDALLKLHPNIKREFKNIISELSKQLLSIAENINNPKKIQVSNMLTKAFTTLEKSILKFKNENNSEDYELYLMLHNFLDYQKKQNEKLKKIKWLLGNPDLKSDDYIKNDKLNRFIVSQDYNPKLLIRNFSFRSNIFKHSLRLAFVVMLGYAVGMFLDFQNPYWIILTIIVIMRPSYGLTKTRTKDRIIGTLIGAILASGLVFLINSPYLYGGLGIIALVIAFSMVQKNYKASATFITLSVIFIYAILEPNILKVIQFRVLDTLIGALLSFAAMLWLWPAWSFMEINEYLKNSLKANTLFFNSITNHYQTKGKVPTSLKVNRKEAFLQTSNLSSAFQRMAQEPKSKQNHIDDIYQLVVVNHSFLSALASLSAYIQNHATTEASKDFKLITNKITNNLNTICKDLATINFEDIELKNKTLETKENAFIFPFKTITNQVLLQTNNIRNHKEAHLIWEQLYWLYSLTEKMLKIVNRFK
ncbi:hypothetical protein BWR22_06380 [Lacinutrix venerupis]|uniref:Membrane protein (TIGR01666 family) n=1 Tax=Lacinutrix venerupis TaxID=1486034 RepID=A0AAC9PWJ8_9FLAO|nr:hypothetical protein BWR22_06380 [Lacinutrix venerupis]